MLYSSDGLRGVLCWNLHSSQLARAWQLPAIAIHSLSLDPAGRGREEGRRGGEEERRRGGRRKGGREEERDGGGEGEERQGEC